MAGAFKTSQQRISALLRVIALFCIVMGGTFAYFISQTTGLIPQMVPIFYFLAVLLIFVGLVVLIARFD